MANASIGGHDSEGETSRDTLHEENSILSDSTLEQMVQIYREQVFIWVFIVCLF